MTTKVLVFESDPAFAGELRSELGKLGCSTTVVDDGNVGLQQASSDRPDLILLSIELPRMNGFSVCNKLKKDPGLKDVPLVIMSSESSDETFEQHKKLRTRAEDYVHKPIAFGELLRHIQTFVPLGAMREAEPSIVIEDDIEVGSLDYLSDDEGAQIAPPAPNMSPVRAAESVDADVDAFADAAFGRLTGSESTGTGVAAPEARHDRNGASEAPTVVAHDRLPIARPPTVTRPPTTVDLGEYERLREDLVRTRDRANQVEHELRDARAEIEKLGLDAGENERLAGEILELRAKVTQPPKAGISSREFLDLREGLNKKDKEILALKEQLSKKDREIVEAQDRALSFERSKSDLDDKSLALERELAELKDKAEALHADKDLAKKASEDFKNRAEKARADAEGKERQLVELRAKHAEDGVASEAKLAVLRAELDQILANERAEHARAIELSEQSRRRDVERAQRDRETAVTQAREQAEGQRQEALASQAAELTREHDNQRAALRGAHEQELETIRDEARSRLESEVTAVQKAKEEELASARTEAERHERLALDALVAEHSEKVASLENDRDSRLAALESRASRQLTEVHDKLAKIEMDLSAARGELDTLRQAKETGDASYESAAAELRSTLAGVTADRDQAEQKLKAASDQVATLEGALAGVRQDLGTTTQRLATESARADRAQAKWEADRQSLERAKDAMAVALAQIEEAEGRS